jgi:tRNA-splicing endonuclease subunit Sen54
VVIPKRGEKDFEPLNETQTIQEKMLRESRQALFDGLSGVRGTSRYVIRKSFGTKRRREGL